MQPENKNILRVIGTALAVGGIGFFGFVIIFQKIFAGDVILPQNISLGRIHVQYYGLILAAAALAGYWLSLRRKEDYKISALDAETILFASLVSGFVGARVYHVLSQIPFYIEHPMQMFAVWNGGLSIFGAGIGGFIALLFYSRKNKNYSLTQLLDWLTPSVVLGQIIGRFGNFLNYELYGNPTSLPWKMFVPKQFRLPPFETFSYFHPLFLYEAAGSLMILILLLKLKLRRGQLFLMWLLLYNVMRFFLEFLRVGSVTYSSIRVNAIVSLVLIITSIYLFWRNRNKNEYKDVIPNSPHN